MHDDKGSDHMMGVMASEEVSTACTSVFVDIICGTLRAKLLTTDLSCGSSQCNQYGSFLLSPCDFQCKAGKASAKNWKITIQYKDQPLARALESYIVPDGK